MVQRIVEEIHLGKPTRFSVEKELALTQKQWAELSPRVQQMIKDGQLHFIELPKTTFTYPRSKN